MLYNSSNVYCKLYNISTQKCTIVQLYNYNFVIVLHCTVDTCSTIQLHLLTVKCTLFQIQSIFVHEMTIGFSSFFLSMKSFFDFPQRKCCGEFILLKLTVLLSKLFPWIIYYTGCPTKHVTWWIIWMSSAYMPY